MIKRTTAFRLLLASAVIVLASLVTVNAHAARYKFGVRVVNPAGQPIEGASVCIGLAGNYSQFGAEITGADGVVMVEVPNLPLTVTVSKTRFAAIRLEQPARGYNLIKEVTLVDGGVPGPRCRAGSTLADADKPGISEMLVKNVDITRGASLLLRPSVSGEPSQYRLSSDSSFANAKWLPYSGTIRVTGALSRESTLFLQLRKYAGNSKGWLEARSDVVNLTFTN